MLGRNVQINAMRALVVAAYVLLGGTIAGAQQREASGFSFDRCFGKCLSLGSSPASCQFGCSDRAATLARIPPGAKRSPNDDPRSPHFHDPEPRRATW
jgi:hypothetical protein